MIELTGIGASGGAAVGPASVHRPERAVVEVRTVEDPVAEQARFDVALATVMERLEHLRDRAEAGAGAEAAEIFEAHQMFLEDPSFSGAAREAILTDAVCAEAAVERVTDQLAAEFQAIGDDYFAQRADDLRDIGHQLVRELLGLGPAGFDHLAEPSVIVAHDLTPSETVTIPTGMALGFCTEIGSPTSHTAILARSLGLPAVVGVGSAEIRDGATVVVDGDRGLLLVDPDPATVERYRSEMAEAAGRRARAEATASQPAVTADGVTVEVAANIGNVDDARRAAAAGADGSGLLRTEFLYLDRDTPPSEEEQVEAYRAILDALAPHPVVVRTLDVGGDKQVAGIADLDELNPFLGVRGLRLTLRYRDVFDTQLRALLRAAAGRPNLKLMFPMVSTVAEIHAARRAVEEVAAGLDAAGIERAADFEIGIMIEVPSAAVMADVLAPHVDFFSIGTNDLTQYTLAADRTNPGVADLADPAHPAVLRLVDGVIRAAHERGRWVGMCGELAGDPAVVPALLGLGLDEFSMAVPSVALVKEAVRTWTVEESRTVAARCLAAADAGEVRRILAEPR